MFVWETIPIDPIDKLMDFQWFFFFYGISTYNYFVFAIVFVYFYRSQKENVLL